MRYDMKPQGVCARQISFDLDGDVVTNVVFTNGAIADDDGKVYIYYAASDMRLHVASTTIGQLLDFAFKNPADPLRSRDCVAQRVALIEKNQAYLNQQDR